MRETHQTVWEQCQTVRGQHQAMRKHRQLEQEQHQTVYGERAKLYASPVNSRINSIKNIQVRAATPLFKQNHHYHPIEQNKNILIRYKFLEFYKIILTLL